MVRAAAVGRTLEKADDDTIASRIDIVIHSDRVDHGEANAGYSSSTSKKNRTVAKSKLSSIHAPQQVAAHLATQEAKRDRLQRSSQISGKFRSHRYS